MRAMPVLSAAGFALASLCVYVIGRSEPAGGERAGAAAPAIRTFGQGRNGAFKSLQSRTTVKRDGREVVVVKYRWGDPHDIRIVKWVGELPVLEAPKRFLDVAVHIDPRRREEVIESFGVSKTWLKTGPGAADREAWIARAARRGIIVDLEEGKFNVSADYPWIVRQSVKDLKPAAEALTRVWKVKAYFTKRQLLAIMASFCQWMEYKTPASERDNAAGETVLTTGVTMPLETLYNGSGDCDTKSLLFASIVANVPKQHVVFLSGRGHMFVGVRAVPRRGDHFIEIQGAKYLLIEITSPWPIGKVPREQMVQWRAKSYRVTRVL